MGEESDHGVCAVEAVETLNWPFTPEKGSASGREVLSLLNRIG